MKGFRISERESVKETINRILYEQIDSILENCENKQDDFHKSIHDIRKSIKRIRAVLRLVREEIGYSSYYRENVFYRDINRSTSELRTLNVLILSLESLQVDLADKLEPERIAPLIVKIREQRDKKLEGMLSSERVLKDLSKQFENGRSRIPTLPIHSNNFKALAGGIERMYRQGKRYLKEAKKKTDTHHLHDMRKRMKYLWYQMDILNPLYPGLLKAYSSSLDSIGDKLGVYHDLAVLSDFLRESKTGLAEIVMDTLIEACEFKKSAMLPDIFSQASAVYTEDPEAFIQRLDGYWKIYFRQIS
jgi:CHAD domain-containing protein